MRAVLDFPPSLCVVAKLFRPHEDVGRSTLHSLKFSRIEMSTRGNSICADESAFSTVKFRRGQREKIWCSALKLNSKLSQRRVCVRSLAYWNIGARREYYVLSSAEERATHTAGRQILTLCQSELVAGHD
jgi:hypothetical protein